MKKPSYLAIIILTIFMLASVIGCSTSLARPTNVDVDENFLLTWSFVENARTYTIEIKNTDTGEILPEITSRKTNVSLYHLDEGNYEVKVMAVAGNSSVSNSVWSNPHSFFRPYITGSVYTLINNNTEYEITRAGTANGVVRIEDEYNNKPVTSIGRGAYKGNVRIEHVILGKNVRSIGDSAFFNCTKLQSVTMNEKLTTIGASAFQSNPYLDNINIPDSVTVIGEYAFAYNKSLANVSIGSGVTTIADNAFVETEIEELTIPDSVTAIGNYAFAKTSALTSVTFGKGLATIGQYAFYDSGVSEINFCEYDVEVPVEGGEEGETTTVKKGTLTSIGNNAFAECKNLTSVRFPVGLQSLGLASFYNATNLETIHLPSTIIQMGAQAFGGTKHYANELENGNGLIYVGNWFVGFDKEKLLTFHDPEMDNYVTGAPTEEHLLQEFSMMWRVLDEGTDAETTNFYIGGKGFKEGTVGIADYAFMDFREIRVAYLPNSIKHIGKLAFYGNTNLFRLMIQKDGVIEIGEMAFLNCINLTNLYLNEGLQVIGSQAFAYCASLQNNTQNSIIPKSVTRIGASAFFDSGLWKNVESGIVYAGAVDSIWVVGFKNTTSTVANVDSQTYGIADYAFANYVTLKEVTGLAGTGSRLRQVGKGAFYGCVSLDTVAFNENVTEIRDFTFYYCDKLAVFHIPERVERIGIGAFYRSGLRELRITSTFVKEIGAYAFYGSTYLTTVNLTKSGSDYQSRQITEIAPYTFYGCENITTIQIPNSVTRIGERAFFNATRLTSVTFGTSVERIEKHAFSGTALERVTIPSNVRYIGNNAFFNCGAIQSLVIENEMVEIEGVKTYLGVETIGDYAFHGLSSLSSLVVPSSVKSIGNYAFKNNVNLEYVLIDNVESIGIHAFYGNKKATIYTTATEQLENWDVRWNTSFRPVVYGCVLSADRSYIEYFDVNENAFGNSFATGTIAAPVRDGYLFKGWTSIYGVTFAEYSASEILTAPNGISLYTIWEQIQPQVE